MCSLYAGIQRSEQYFIVATASKGFLCSLSTAFQPEYYSSAPESFARTEGGWAGVAPECSTIFVMLVAVCPSYN